MRATRTFALLAICALASVASAKDRTKDLSIEEGATRAALQDIVGNICPGVQPDYAMRLVLVVSLRDKDAVRWASGYDKGAREVLDIVSKPEGRAAVCENALRLYGPNGEQVPHLLKEE